MRPPHLVRRQIQGRMFSEPVVIVRVSTTRNRFGEGEATEAPEETLCATAPAGSGARVRELMEAGVRLDAMRLFWTIEDIDPAVEGRGPGDIVIYGGERYRADTTQRWGGFSETLGVRQEAQE